MVKYDSLKKFTLQALVLAAGRSKRFWPLPDKNFLQLGAKTLIENQIETLRKAGIKKIVIVGGAHNLVRLKKLFPRTKIIEQKNLDEGMAGAVLAAEKMLTQPTLIVSTNDVVSTAAVKKVVTVKNCDGALLAQKVKHYFPGGYLKVGRGRIFNIVEKPGEGKEPSSLINIVYHFFREPKKLITALKKVENKKKDDRYERALAQLFKTQKFLAIENVGVWQPVKFPWHTLDLVADFLSKIKKRRISPHAQIAKTAVISGAVVIESGVKILDYAVVIGPTFIGKNSVVGTHSLVRDSVIGANSVVGSQSEVARALLGERVWLHRNYVGDSVIADNVNLGAGVVTANFRLDAGEVKAVVENKKVFTGRRKFGCVIGVGCRIGVNTSVMPGSLIGQNSFIGSGVVISKNIPDGVFSKKQPIVLVLNKKISMQDI